MMVYVCDATTWQVGVRVNAGKCHQKRNDFACLFRSYASLEVVCLYRSGGWPVCWLHKGKCFWFSENFEKVVVYCGFFTTKIRSLQKFWISAKIQPDDQGYKSPEVSADTTAVISASWRWYQRLLLWKRRFTCRCWSVRVDDRFWARLRVGVCTSGECTCVMAPSADCVHG